MALGATIRKVELSISDMDRHYYASHQLTLAQHPSETPQRLMARLLAFILYADEQLEFGRGLSDEEEAALVRKTYSGEIALWIEVGQPSEARIRKACGQAHRVVVLNYAGRNADLWWEKAASQLRRHDNLNVLNIDTETLEQLVALCDRSMRLQCLVQDGELQIIDANVTFAFRPQVRQGQYNAA